MISKCDSKECFFGHLFLGNCWLLLFDDNKMKMARKPGKKQKENPVGCTGEGKRCKGNERRAQRR